MRYLVNGTRSCIAVCFAFCPLLSAFADTPALVTIDFPGALSTQSWGISAKGDIVGLYSLPDKSAHGFLLSGGRYTSIDYPGAVVTNAWGINSKGDIVGDYTVNGVMHGFVLSQGRFNSVDVPGAVTTSLAAINAAGEIVAAYTLPDKSTHTVLVRGNTFRSIEHPNATTTLGNGINSRGDVVGNYTIAGLTRAFMLSAGKLTEIEFKDAAFTGAYGVDPSGNIVGRYRDAGGVTHGYILSGGVYTTIDVPGATFTGAAAINAGGEIVGRYTLDGVTHAFLMTSPVLHYTVADLGGLSGGDFSQAGQGVTDNGLVAGAASLPGGSQHATLWRWGQAFDLASPGLGGANSFAFSVNSRGQVVGEAETTTSDREDFCAYGTGFQCLPFFWQNGLMIPLPTLGGKNGAASAINAHGEVAGVAETTTIDPLCPAPQFFDYQAVVWGPRQGAVQVLPPLPGDSVGIALWINDKGQVVGTSGACKNTVTAPIVVGPHAVLWDSDGSILDLGSLGGTVNVELPAVGNRALGVNNRGQVVGGSALAGNTAAHAFLWTRESGMKDLGVLPGDVNSAALAINERTEVVGVSLNDKGDPHPILWRNGVLTDLNFLAPDSPIHLLFAQGIDERGEITGFGVTKTGEVHAFLASPIEGHPATEPGRMSAATSLSSAARRALNRILGSTGGVLPGR